MDCRTGEIVGPMTEDDIRIIEGVRGRPLARMTHDQALEALPLSGFKRKNYMRNQPCPCKSGRKFKRCCWNKYA